MNPIEKLQKLKPACRTCPSCLITVDFESHICDRCRKKKEATQLLEKYGNKKSKGGIKMLRDKILKCRRCKLYKSRTQAVVGRGSKKPTILFIGEAPGYWEDKKGKPFVGNAGKILNKAISLLGLKKESYYITNVVKCRPVDDNGNNRAPSDFEKEKCAIWLTKQIKRFNPVVIIPLGYHATQHILKRKFSIVKIAGKLKKFGNMAIFPLLHPASILHQSKYTKLWQKHLRNLKKFLEAKDIIELKDKQATLKRWFK